MRSIKRSISAAEGWWFDVSRGVKTAGNVPLSRLSPSSQTSYDYIVARTSNVRRALRDLPIQDHSAFTFIDLGSGKGPILFIAAEFPYRRIRGVEFAHELHLLAMDNIASYRNKMQRCRDIESIHMDVKDFEFPEDNLVVYFFNPFPAATLERALANLHVSLSRKPREVLLISLYPARLASVLQSQPWLHLTQSTPRYETYRAVLA